MQIALISNFLSGPGRGGAERYASMLAQQLAEAGNEVTIYSGSDAVLPGVRCHKLPGMAELDLAASPTRKAAWHLREQWLPRVHRELRAALRRASPDVVHSHEPQLLSAAVFTAIAAENVPHVHTAHDFNLLCARVTMTKDGSFCGGRCLECRMQRAIRTNAIRRRLDLLLAPSDFVRDRHVRYGVTSDNRALTIRHGAEPGSRRVRIPSSGGLRLGYLGTLAEHKGVRTLLRATKAMPAGWTLDLAGSGPLTNEVLTAVKRDSRISYAGEITGAARDSFLDRLDVIVIPSEWEEPATLVAVEAAVRGLPAVVSDRGGLPETPQASVFSAGDSRALLGALSDLDQVPTMITRRSEALLNSSNAYEWTTHVQRVEAALAGVASKS